MSEDDEAAYWKGDSWKPKDTEEKVEENKNVSVPNDNKPLIIGLGIAALVIMLAIGVVVVVGDYVVKLNEKRFEDFEKKALAVLEKTSPPCYCVSYDWEGNVLKYQNEKQPFRRSLYQKRRRSERK